MGKVIIDYEGVPAKAAAHYVSLVLARGYESKSRGIPQCCFVTSFSIPSGELTVWARERRHKKAADSFRVTLKRRA